MKAKFKDYDADVQKKQEELKKLKDDLEKQAMLLSAEARAAKERDYQQKVKDYQRLTKDIQEELQRTDADLLARFSKRSSRSSSRSAAGRYTMILEKTESSILYASDGIDMTDRLSSRSTKQSAASEPVMRGENGPDFSGYAAELVGGQVRGTRTWLISGWPLSIGPGLPRSVSGEPEIPGAA